MRQIVVTGGIGTGKSTVTKILSKEFNIPYVSFDEEWHKWLVNNNTIIHSIAQRYGSYVKDIDGNIDRKKLGKLVFSNTDILNDFTHHIKPFVIVLEKIHKKIYEYEDIIFEVPLTADKDALSRWLNQEYLTIGLFVSRFTQKQRILKRYKDKNETPDMEYIQNIMDAQPSVFLYESDIDILHGNYDGDNHLKLLINNVTNKLLERSLKGHNEKCCRIPS